MRVRRILCPTDFSEFSRRAVDQAVALAGWYGAELSLLHVYPYLAIVSAEAPYLPSGLPLDAGMRARLLADLEAAAEPARAAGVKTEVLLLEGDPSEEILRRAHRAPTDVVVMGTHGRRGFDRWVIGSVATRVVQRARCPVVTVPPAPEKGGPRAGDPILCPVELSGSEAVVEAAVSVAHASKARLTLLHVLEDLPQQDAAARIAHIERGELRERLEHEAGERLRELAASQGAAAGEVAALVVSGRPYREILKLAEARPFGLIVMGIHGLNPVERLFVGSTALHVLRGAHCPLLTVRPDERSAV